MGEPCNVGGNLSQINVQNRSFVQSDQSFDKLQSNLGSHTTTHYKKLNLQKVEFFLFSGEFVFRVLISLYRR